jgi:hypothetical protein
MTYTGHVLYRLLTVLCVVLVALFGWQLSQRWDWGALLFLVVAAWSALRCIILMLTKIEVDEERVQVLAPLTAPRSLEFRQCAAVYEEGRGLQSILLLYHPRAETGLLALDEERTFALPAVNRQAELLATLTERVNHWAQP